MSLENIIRLFFLSQIPEAVERSEPASEWVAAWLSFIKADIMDLRYRTSCMHLRECP
jgi:hypothetical protein